MTLAERREEGGRGVVKYPNATPIGGVWECSSLLHVLIYLFLVGPVFDQKTAERHVIFSHSTDERSPAVAAAGHIRRCASVEKQGGELHMLILLRSIPLHVDRDKQACAC